MGIFFAASAKRIRGEKLIEEEKAAVGGVEWAVYYGYAKSIGIIFTICSISFYGIYQVTTITNNYRLFVCQDENETNPKTKVFICSG